MQGEVHRELGTIRLARVRELVTDTEFMGVTINEGLRAELRQAVETKKNLFRH
jgi:hypothetical protein